MVDSMETPPMQKLELSSSQQSRDMFSGQSVSQELQRPKPGEPGWLVSLAESMEEGRVDRSTPNLDGKRERTKHSQDSGKGKSLTSKQTSSQASKTSASQVSSSQSSISSAFELLASEEVTSQVLLYREEARQTQDSQEVAGDASAAEVEETADKTTDKDIAEDTNVDTAAAVTAQSSAST